MSVRKRDWTTSKGEQREAWIVAYSTRGERHIKTFARKKDADQFHASVRVDVAKGIHVPASKSVTVSEAAQQWLNSCDSLERSTVDSYVQHVDLHIVPFIGGLKLSQLTVAAVREWQDKLRRGDPARGETQGAKRSADMVRRCTISLGALIADAQERGLVAQNVVRSLKSNRQRGKDRQAERRTRGKLEIGKDVPSNDEVKRVLEISKGTRWRPLLLVACFCGLRSSELRGLRWSDVDFRKGELHVRQRLDKYNSSGAPKSAAGTRAVPLPPQVVAELREWKLACPKGPMDLCFPNRLGNPENHANIANRGFLPIQIEAGVVERVTGEQARKLFYTQGRPTMRAKYSLHDLRHWFVSWCLSRNNAGGRELPLKEVSALAGHSSISLTADRYAHLLPASDHSKELAAATEGFFR
jgi:integrase